MPLKNYTTEISASKSIGEIQTKLVAHGAKAIMVNYNGERQSESLSFIIPVKGGEVPFQLPCNLLAVEKLLSKTISPDYRTWDSAYQAQRAKKIHEQAYRVAWRILKDWIDAQLAIIETEMVTLDQVFLPYMTTGSGKTLYQVMIDRGFYLTDGKG